MTRSRALLVVWVHLLVLWSFAFAQPLFDLLSDNPEFFVARGNTRADILLLASGLVLVPPTALLAIEAALLPLSKTASSSVHVLFVSLLASAFFVQLLGDVPLPGAVLLIVALALGAAFGLAYAGEHFVPSLLTVLAPAPAVFLLLFLVVSPVSKLVFPGEETSIGGVDIRDPAPVVMVVFDELSEVGLMDASRRIDAGRFPSFAALAGDATWYRNATTVADVTQLAVPALLTGENPDPDALPIAADNPGNLFSLLGGKYAFKVIEPVTDLCPARLCPENTRAPASRRLRGLVSDLSVVSLHLLLPEGLREGLPAVDRSFGNFRDEGPRVGAAARHARGDKFRVVHRFALEDRVRQLEQFRRGLDSSSRRPELHYLHVQLPHLPYRYLPSGQQYPVRALDPPGLRAETWSADSWLSQQAFQRYTLQLGYVDHFLGQVLDELRASGLYERSLVVVTADHGVSFGAGGSRRAVSRANVGEIAGVPLIVKAPRQARGRIDDSNVRLVDVLPTIAGHLGAKLPWETHGRSLLSGERSDSEPVVVRSTQGEAVGLPFRAYVRERDAAVRERLALFRSGGGFGPAVDLVGTSLEALPVGGGPNARVELDSPELYAFADPRKAVVPAFVTGRFSQGGRAGQTLAVSLNGVVEATTRAYRAEGGEVRFAAMVPPTSLRRGRNVVGVFAVQGNARSRRVVALSGGQAPVESFKLTKRGGRDVLVTVSGREIAIRRGAVLGAYENISFDYGEGRFAVDGWAASPDRGPAERVAVFVDGQLVLEGRPSVPRPDVAKELGPDTNAAGFELSGMVDRDSEVNRRSKARVFAIIGGSASELERR
jgi:hypothetical protein